MSAQMAQMASSRQRATAGGDARRNQDFRSRKASTQVVHTRTPGHGSPDLPGDDGISTSPSQIGEPDAFQQRHETIRANTPLGIVDGEICTTTWSSAPPTATPQPPRRAVSLRPTGSECPTNCSRTNCGTSMTDAAPGSFIRFFESRDSRRRQPDRRSGPGPGSRPGHPRSTKTRNPAMSSPGPRTAWARMIKMAYEDLRDNADDWPPERPSAGHQRPEPDGGADPGQGTGSGNSWNGIITQDLATAPPTGKRVSGSPTSALSPPAPPPRPTS